jgi:hypothetical protein
MPKMALRTIRSTLNGRRSSLRIRPRKAKPRTTEARNSPSPRKARPSSMRKSTIYFA